MKIGSFARAVGAVFAVLAGVLGLMVAGSSAAQGATAINSCRTISAPGNYFLTGNLTTKNADCLTLTSSNVNIDLRGFTISGNGTHSGITGDTLVNVVINNG